MFLPGARASRRAVNSAESPIHNWFAAEKLPDGQRRRMPENIVIRPEVRCSTAAPKGLSPPRALDSRRSTSPPSRRLRYRSARGWRGTWDRRRMLTGTRERLTVGYQVGDVAASVPRYQGCRRLQTRRVVREHQGNARQYPPSYLAGIRETQAADGSPALAPPASVQLDLVSQIERLASPHQAGALTDEEFAEAKAALLKSM